MQLQATIRPLSLTYRKAIKAEKTEVVVRRRRFEMKGTSFVYTFSEEDEPNLFEGLDYISVTIQTQPSVTLFL